MNKKVRDFLIATLAGAQLIAPMTGCTQKDITDPPPHTLPQSDIDNQIIVNNVNLEEDLSLSYPNTYTTDSIYLLSQSFINEAKTLHNIHNTKEVTPILNKELLTAIFMCESSFSINVDKKTNNSSFAGIGQISKDAIYDSLQRINNICKDANYNDLQTIHNNYYIEIFQKYVGDPTQEYTEDQIKEASRIIFKEIESNQNQNSTKLGGALSTMAICANAGNNDSAFKQDKKLIIMSYYCGAGSVRKYLNSGLVQLKNTQLSINLEILDSGKFDTKEIDTFKEGLIYMIKIMNILNKTKNQSLNHYKTNVDEIIQDIGTFDQNRWQDNISDIEGLIINQNLEMGR